MVWNSKVKLWLSISLYFNFLVQKQLMHIYKERGRNCSGVKDGQDVQQLMAGENPQGQ